MKFPTFRTIALLMIVAAANPCFAQLETMITHEWVKGQLPASDARRLNDKDAAKQLETDGVARGLGSIYSVKSAAEVNRMREQGMVEIEKSIWPPALNDGSRVVWLLLRIKSKYREYHQTFSDDRGNTAEVFAFFTLYHDYSWEYGRNDLIEVHGRKCDVSQALEELFAGANDSATLHDCQAFVTVGTASAAGSNQSEEDRSDLRACNLAASLYHQIVSLHTDRPLPKVHAISLGRYTASSQDRAEQRPILIFAIAWKDGTPDIARIVTKCLDDPASPRWLQHSSYSRKATPFIDWEQK